MRQDKRSPRCAPLAYAASRRACGSRVGRPWDRSMTASGRRGRFRWRGRALITCRHASQPSSRQASTLRRWTPTASGMRGHTRQHVPRLAAAPRLPSGPHGRRARRSPPPGLPPRSEPPARGERTPGWRASRADVHPTLPACGGARAGPSPAVQGAAGRSTEPAGPPGRQAEPPPGPAPRRGRGRAPCLPTLGAATRAGPERWRLGQTLRGESATHRIRARGCPHGAVAGAAGCPRRRASAREALHPRPLGGVDGPRGWTHPAEHGGLCVDRLDDRGGIGRAPGPPGKWPRRAPVG